MFVSGFGLKIYIYFKNIFGNFEVSDPVSGPIVAVKPDKIRKTGLPMFLKRMDPPDREELLATETGERERCVN